MTNDSSNDLRASFSKTTPNGGGGGGRLPNKGRYGCAGPGIRYFRGQFLPGH